MIWLLGAIIWIALNVALGSFIGRFLCFSDTPPKPNRRRPF